MLRALFPTLLLLASVTGCASSGRDRPVVTAEAVVDSKGVQRVDVYFHRYYFEPNRIIVRAGRPVEIVAHNRSWVVPHNLTIADSSLSVSVGGWGPFTRRARFIPETSGEFRFFCHVGGHAKKGMTGTLVVLP